MNPRNEHTPALKKLGLVSLEPNRRSCTWDYSHGTLANVFGLAPKEKVLMDDLEKYFHKHKYKHKATNSALVYEGEGQMMTVRCYYYIREKFSFFVVMTRQRKGKKEYVTRAEFHYEKAPEPKPLVEKPKAKVKAKVTKEVKPKKKAKKPEPKAKPVRRRLR